MAHLMRTWYRTDVGPGDPDYVGAFSGTIPDRVFTNDGWQIVHVDWSSRGEVEVTFLVPGEGRPATTEDGQ